MKKILFLTTMLALPLMSNASVITFDDAPFGTFSTLSTEGYDVTASSDGLSLVTPGGNDFCGPACVYNGTNFLMGWLGGSFTLSKSDGSSFSVFGFDGGETHMEREAFWATHILLTGTKQNGAVIAESFALDFINDGQGPLNDFQTFTTSGDFTDLVSLKFEGLNNSKWFTVDNVQTSPSTPVSEPSSVLLLALGLAGLLFSRKKIS